MTRDEQTKETDDRDRLRIYRIEHGEILNAFRELTQPSNFLCLPRIKDLPTGYEILGVLHDFETRAFKFLVRHSSFDVVPPHIRPPDLSAELTSEFVEIISPPALR